MTPLHLTKTDEEPGGRDEGWITTPTFPIKKVACSTIKSLPDPELAAFFLRIHFRIELAWTPNILPSALIETP
jgi:hypothetical protein